MRIEQELKLGFKDVLFRPKRSTLKSRSQVNLTRELHSNIVVVNGLACLSLPPIWTLWAASTWRKHFLSMV